TKRMKARDEGGHGELQAITGEGDKVSQHEPRIRRHRPEHNFTKLVEYTSFSPLCPNEYASSPKSTPTLPNFNQRFGTASAVTSHGGVLPGFTSHRGSPYSPAPAPAHTPSISYSPSAESSVGNPALWGSYDTSAALQQYSVVSSGNSSVSRGRSASSSMSAAASLSA
ncbi:hypothetical protein L9F63_003095, partial [Diploptera punctata]